VEVMSRIIAFVILILLSPLFLFITVLIILSSKGPPFFLQRRIGQYEKSFRIIKFRTMRKGMCSIPGRGKDGDWEARITPVGRFLRNSRLDELPQLINVIKGDMSFIGPRPLIRSEGSIHYWRKIMRVYDVKPGLTCLAHLRGVPSFEGREMAKLDLYYVQNRTPGLNFRIVSLTLIFIVRGGK